MMISRTPKLTVGFPALAGLAGVGGFLKLQGVGAPYAEAVIVTLFASGAFFTAARAAAEDRLAELKDRLDSGAVKKKGPLAKCDRVTLRLDEWLLYTALYWATVTLIFAVAGQAEGAA